MTAQIVGYQLSTLYFDGAHLARLAISPVAQGKGVARALLSDVLTRFDRRGVRTMTVNTQSSNLRSQRLYTGYGFERNGYDLPVWIAGYVVLVKDFEREKPHPSIPSPLCGEGKLSEAQRGEVRK